MIRVQSDRFDAGAETEALGAGDIRAGCVATFIGRVRGDDGLLAMTLEHYPAMTEKVMEEIEREVRARWPLLDVRIVHRIGRLAAGEAIVFAGVAAAHRQDAFAAAHYVMDQVKTRAPFWKKEHRASGDRWVEAAKADDAAAMGWEAKRK
jgi:molybdopterin synthase catalytic subunit